MQRIALGTPLLASETRAPAAGCPLTSSTRPWTDGPPDGGSWARVAKNSNSPRATAAGTLAAPGLIRQGENVHRAFAGAYDVLLARYGDN